MKKIFIVIVFVIIGNCLFGCKKLPNNIKEYVTVIDMEGAKVKVPTTINRVACISQSATDLMIAFGLGEKIVGTYRSFMYNPWVVEIYPYAENYKSYSYSVSAEELLADEIELVIIQDSENISAYKNAGIPVVVVHQYSDDIFDEEMYDTARILGNIFGDDVKKKSDEWIKEVKNTILEIDSVIGNINSEKSVYYINGEKPKGLFYSDGGNSMISRILNIANMRLATEKYKVLNVHNVSDEEMIQLNPYAMLIGGVYQNELEKTLYGSSTWNLLDCVKNNRVYRIPVAMVGIENISAETPIMLKYIASMFNENYKFDVYEELKTNIQKYFNYTLSDMDIDNMCKGFSKNGKKVINLE